MCFSHSLNVSRSEMMAWRLRGRISFFIEEFPHRLNRSVVIPNAGGGGITLAIIVALFFARTGLV